MLTSFFRKSKPITSAVIGLLMLWYFISAQMAAKNFSFELIGLLKITAAL